MTKTEYPCCYKCTWVQDVQGNWYCPYGGPFFWYVVGYGKDKKIIPIEKTKRDGE